MRLAVYISGVDSLVQRIVIGDSPISMEGMLVHVARVGNPSGTMRLQLVHSDGVTVLSQADVLLSTLTGAYWHGNVRFDVRYPLEAEGVYYIVMNSAGGYSYDPSNYFGVVRADYLAFKDKYGMDFRILEYKTVTRRQG